VMTKKVQTSASSYVIVSTYTYISPNGSVRTWKTFSHHISPPVEPPKSSGFSGVKKPAKSALRSAAQNVEPARAVKDKTKAAQDIVDPDSKLREVRGRAPKLREQIAKPRPGDDEGGAGRTGEDPFDTEPTLAPGAFGGGGGLEFYD